MSDDQAREMRPETTSEHIARDMREGRFPEQSERQMVPVLASLPHEIQVWLSMDALDHTGTWSTTRYPAEAVTYVSKADAQAAVALALEEAAENKEQLEIWAHEILAGLAFADVLKIDSYNDKIEAHDMVGRGLVEVIRALAPADGLAAVDALRAQVERATSEIQGFQDLARENMRQWGAAVTRAETAEAELSAAQQRERALVDALEDIAKQKRTDELDTEHDVEMADFEGGYDAAINVARAALASGKPGEAGNV